MITGILIALAVIGGGSSVYFLMRKRDRRTSHTQATVLLESIKRVCKVVSVQGSFVEVLDYSNSKPVLLGFKSTKKALLIVRGTAFVGIDLAKASFTMVAEQRTVRIDRIPAAEVISLETAVQYYHLENGYTNKFSAEDHTRLDREARQLMQEKVSESHLLPLANDKVHEELQIIRTMIEAFGWKLALPEHVPSLPSTSPSLTASAAS